MRDNKGLDKLVLGKERTVMDGKGAILMQVATPKLLVNFPRSP